MNKEVIKKKTILGGKMASEHKKNKCRHSSYDRGGIKGHLFHLKREAMYHKKDRVANKKLCEAT